MHWQAHAGQLLAWAPAKLNLFLEVLGKREDGYHEIQSLMVTVDLHDTLWLKEDPSGEVTLRCDDVFQVGLPQAADLNRAPEGPDNLVVQAVHLLRAETGSTRGVAVRLRKRIPLAAGLAGGSSDAAATLAGLNRLWDLRLSREQLGQLAAKLGSDVAFFLHAPAAICTGRGEQVRSIRLPQVLHFVIVCPPVGLATAQVYRALGPVESPLSIEPLSRALLEQGVSAKVGQLLANRLEAPARQLCPAVDQLKRRFACLPWLGHQVSGSGTAYFGLCRTRRQARRWASWLRSQHLGRVFVVRSSS